MIPNGVLLINTFSQDISYANKELINIVGAGNLPNANANQPYK